jgi:hypothetical protein
VVSQLCRTPSGTQLTRVIEPKEGPGVVVMSFIVKTLDNFLSSDPGDFLG